MHRTKLDKLRRELERLRRSPQRSDALKRIAASLGRKMHGGGKHPVWISQEFPSLRPVSIPDHPGDIPTGTKNSILNQLDNDIFAWEEQLDEE